MSNRLSELRTLSPEQLLARAGEVLPPWVALLLVLAIAWQLVKLTWLLLPGAAVATAETPTVSPRDSAPATVSYDLGRIAGANLFGVAAPVSEAVPVTDSFDEVDETQLELTLRGTIAANDDRVALAIIAGDNGEEKVYSVGDAVSDGRKLHSVLPDRAILNNNGELESLRLPKEYESKPATRTVNRRTSTSRTPTATRAGRELQRTLSENPAKLTDLIRPQPVFSNGKQLGYRVYPGRRRQQFVALGLKPGDLVTEINGTPLNDPAKGADIFRSLSESNQVTVTVERNGSPEVLVLDTEQINNSQGGQKR